MEKKKFDDNLIDLSERVYNLEKENQDLKNQLKEKDKMINVLKSEINYLKEKMRKKNNENNQVNKKEIMDFIKKKKQVDINELDLNLINPNTNIDVNKNIERNQTNLENKLDKKINVFNIQNNSNNSNLELFDNYHLNIDKNKKNDLIDDDDIFIDKIEDSFPKDNNIKKDNENNLENLDRLLALQMQMEMEKEYKNEKTIREHNDSNIDIQINNYPKRLKVNNKNYNDNNSPFKHNFDILNQFNFIGPNIRNNYPQKINRYRPISGNRERNLMAINKIDNMTYEELLELEKKMGKVSQGLTKEQIDQLLFEVYSENNNKEDNICTICKNNFENGEKIRRLGCNHIFHMECIDPWLLEKKTCPVCLNEIKFDD